MTTEYRPPHFDNPEPGKERFDNLVGSEQSRGQILRATFGEQQHEGVLMASMDAVVNWVRRNSIWPMTLHLLGARGRRLPHLLEAARFLLVELHVKRREPFRGRFVDCFRSEEHTSEL